jgi:chromosome partitioning protein
MGANRTLVVNAKGGVGKTTIATNLASYFAANRIPTAIVDYDPQGSSLNWLKQRSPGAPPIHGADGAGRGATGLKSVKRYVPPETRQVVIDAPAGLSRLLMQDLLGQTRSILIPVAPSAIDVHATANFIKELLLVGGVRHRNIRVAVVANRIRSAKPVYEPLERFVGSLGIAFLTRLHDSDIYIEAAENGIGIFEMELAESAQQREEFLPIVQWVEEVSPPDARRSNVVPLDSFGPSRRSSAH